MTIPITANAVGDIIALVQLGLGAVQRLNNARGARAEYREIQSRLESLNSLLELCVASVNSLSDPNHKDTVMVHIDRAYAQIDAALQLLPSYKHIAAENDVSSPSNPRSIRLRVRDASTSLSWELRQSAKARTCLVKLSESIQTIQLAITAANGAHSNTQFQVMSATIANAGSVTLTMQSDISVARSLVESMDARFSSVQDALSYRTARHSEATNVSSEIQATLRETIANEMAGVRADLSAQAHRALQQQSSSAAAAGIAQQLEELQRTVDSLRHMQSRRSAKVENGAPLHRLISLHSLRLTISTTTLIRISQAVVPSNELVSGGCIGSFLVLAASATRSTDQAAYLLCACLLFIATRMHRMYQSPVVVHVVFIVDLFGDEIQLPLHEAKSAEHVHVALRRQFRPGRLGFKLTQNRMYDLAMTDDEAVLGSLLPDSWMNLLRPGQKLIMNARIQDTANHNELACPACGTRSSSPEEPTSQGRWIKCTRCPARFECSSRETVEQDISTDPETSHSVEGGPRQDTPSQNAETDVPDSEPLNGTTIEQELALCKRIRILSLTVSIMISSSSRAPSDITDLSLPPLPPLVRDWSPVHYPVFAPRPSLNPLLCRYALNYNLLFESNVAAVEHETLTASQLNEPATNPSVVRMLVMPVWSRSRTPPAGFPRRLIEVTSPVSPVTPVTLVDVLDAVHEWLHRQVKREAFERSSPEEQRIAGRAFWERVRRAGSPGEQESVRMQGLKRIDYLDDQNYFAGLTPLKHQPDISTLHFIVR